MRGERIDFRSVELLLKLSERSALRTSCFTAGKIPPSIRSEGSATFVDTL